MCRCGPVVVLAIAACAVAGCTNPEIEAQQWDEIQTVAQTVTEMRQYLSDLEGRVDSLRGVTAKQDTALRLIVDFTGANVPGYRQ